MSKAKLTIDRLKEVLSYNTETGQFTWLSDRAAVKCGTLAGSLNQYGYLTIGIDRRSYLAHRLAWFYVTGEFPSSQIDHKNRIKLDNRFENLRLVAPRENMQNRESKGISFHKLARKWQAQIRINGKNTYLGLFDDEQSAIDAYTRAKAASHPFFYESQKSESA